MRLRTIVIDVGKDFRGAALEWFPKYGLRKIDAILLTHDHADGSSIQVHDLLPKITQDFSMCSDERSGRPQRSVSSRSFRHFSWSKNRRC